LLEPRQFTFNEILQYAPRKTDLKSPLLLRIYEYQFHQAALNFFWVAEVGEVEDAVDLLLSSLSFYASMLEDPHIKKWMSPAIEYDYVRYALNYAAKTYPGKTSLIEDTMKRVESGKVYLTNGEGD